MNEVKSNKDLVYNTLNLMFNSVIGEGGDGDAIWLTKFFSLEYVKEILEEYNVDKKTGWEIIADGENSISWGTNQEWARITNSEEEYKNAPYWVTMKISF